MVNCVSEATSDYAQWDKGRLGYLYCMRVAQQEADVTFSSETFWARVGNASGRWLPASYGKSSWVMCERKGCTNEWNSSSSCCCIQTGILCDAGVGREICSRTQSFGAFFCYRFSHSSVGRGSRIPHIGPRHGAELYRLGLALCCRHWSREVQAWIQVGLCGLLWALCCCLEQMWRRAAGQMSCQSLSLRRCSRLCSCEGRSNMLGLAFSCVHQTLACAVSHLSSTKWQVCLLTDPLSLHLAC